MLFIMKNRNMRKKNQLKMKGNLMKNKNQKIIKRRRKRKRKKGVRYFEML